MQRNDCRTSFWNIWSVESVARTKCSGTVKIYLTKLSKNMNRATDIKVMRMNNDTGLKYSTKPNTNQTMNNHGN